MKMLKWIDLKALTLGAVFLLALVCLSPLKASSEGYSEDGISEAGEIVTVGEEDVVGEQPQRNQLKAACSYWETSKSYTGMSYGSWQTQVNRKKCSPNGTITATVSGTVSTSYSGSIKVGAKKVESVLGFSLNSLKNYSVGNTFKCKKGKEYKVQMRKRYKTYKVTQKRVTIDSWTGKKLLCIC